MSFVFRKNETSEEELRINKIWTDSHIWNFFWLECACPIYWRLRQVYHPKDTTRQGRWNVFQPCTFCHLSFTGNITVRSCLLQCWCFQDSPFTTHSLSQCRILYGNYHVFYALIDHALKNTCPSTDNTFLDIFNLDVCCCTLFFPRLREGSFEGRVKKFLFYSFVLSTGVQTAREWFFVVLELSQSPNPFLLSLMRRPYSIFTSTAELVVWPKNVTYGPINLLKASHLLKN